VTGLGDEVLEKVTAAVEYGNAIPPAFAGLPLNGYSVDTATEAVLIVGLSHIQKSELN
jgi:hypothetical protein